MKKMWVWVLFGVVIWFVFGNLFSGSLAFGDAPHFFGEEAQELVNEPWAWVSRENNFGGINKFVFLWPVMLVYGLLSGWGLGNNEILLGLFYIPSLVMGCLGMKLLMKHWKYGVAGQVVAMMMYVLNTYFLLIVDGGVVGLVLAYGGFPLALLAMFWLAKKPGYWKFVWALILNQLVVTADPRVGVLVWVSFGLLEGISFVLRKNKRTKDFVWLWYVLLGVVLMGLNAYWLLPLVKLQNAAMVSEIGGGAMKFRDSLSLFLPHWPGNELGKTMALPVVFLGVPFLVLTSVVFRKSRVVLVMFVGYLVFAAMAAGHAPVRRIPFGFAFRDSSKFMIPLVLTVSVMVGALAEKAKGMWGLLIGGYVVFLVLPVVRGEMNFVLSDREHEGYEQIARQLASEQGYFRTAWYPERHPLDFQTIDKPAVDARDLVDLRPLARLNVGEDRYNYINWEHNHWLDLLGIKYLILADDSRVTGKSRSESDHWENLQSLMRADSDLRQVEWSDKVAVYENEGVLPRVFGAEKLIAVVGGDSFYDELEGLPAPTVFFEDGKFEPDLLNGLPKGSVEIYMNGKSKEDLVMSFLQEHFVEMGEALESEWAVYGNEENLAYKYQLLQREKEHNEFDYNRGLAFSSERGEKVVFEFEVEEEGEYALGIRYDQLEGSEQMVVEFDGVEKVARKGGYGWYTKQMVLEQGTHVLKIESGAGLTVANVVALVPIMEYVEAERQAETYLAHFPAYSKASADKSTIELDVMEVEYSMKSPFWYELMFSEGVNWVVLTDSYHSKWRLSRDQLSYGAMPAYSAVNIFYKRPEWKNKVELHFDGQKEVRWGMYWTILAALGTVIGLLWFYPKNK